MDSKVVLITGSSSGIGEATAKLFAKNGYKVVVHGHPSQELVDKVVAECDKLSPNNNRALGLVVDFSIPDEADFVVAKTIEHFGRLDVLVNNAGAFIAPSSQDYSPLYQSYEKTKAINIDATIKVTYSAIKHLLKSNDDPNIVFMSSVFSSKPSRGRIAYSVSKAAMTMFARCLAIELAPHIRSNVVSAGPVFTPIFKNAGMYTQQMKESMGSLTLLKRMGESEEIAEAIFYLAQRNATWITGTDLVLDGGFSIA